MSNPEDWFECPVCEISYDTKQEAIDCRATDLREGGMVERPDGTYAHYEDVWDPEDEDYIESI
jgi:hypothetical protein